MSQDAGQIPAEIDGSGTAKPDDFESDNNPRLDVGVSPKSTSVRGGFGSQYPEDQNHWREAKRIFGDVFPPISDPLSPMVDRPRPSPHQVSAIQKFREDENRIRRMVETGILSPDPMPIPHPSRADAHRHERHMYLACEERRAAEIHAHRGQKLFRLPLGYEGPGNSRVRRFMVREGFVIDVPRYVIDSVDSVRVAVLLEGDGQSVIAAYAALQAGERTRKTEFPGVRRKPGRIEIDRRSSYQPTIGLWVRRLMADLEQRGLAFSTVHAKLIVAFRGDALDEQTLGLILPNAEIIRAAVSENDR